MAIINHTYGFIFIHIPKNAGSAITRYLSQFSDEEDMVIGVTPKGEEFSTQSRNLGLSKHASCAEIQRFLGPEKWCHYLKFVVVRNPYSRAYSIYTFLKKKFREWKNAEIMDTFQSFDDFVKSDFFQSSGPDRIFHPQSFWLPPTEDALYSPLYIGRQENLNDDFSELTELIGLPPLDPLNGLELVNASSDSVEWHSATDSPTIKEIIQKKYSQDFKRFGYPL